MGRVTLGEVWTESGDPWGGLERVGRHSDRSGTLWGLSGRFRTGRETLEEVQDGKADSRGGSRWVRGPSGVRNGSGSLLEVYDGLGGPRGGPGRVSGSL